MVMIVKLKHIDELAGGRERFRRRWPKDVGKALGETFMQKPIKAREGAALVSEHTAMMKTFEVTVAAHRRSDEERARMSPRELWHEAQGEADRLTSGIVGDVEGAEDALAEEAQRNADKMLYRAIKTPKAEKPQPTLGDAFALYEETRIDDTQRRDLGNTVKRLRRRAEKALGNPAGIRLADLKRAHGNAFLKVLQQERTPAGKPLSAGTIERELSILASITEKALLEFDLAADVRNPFRKLDVRRPSDAPEVAREKRLPLPDEVIAQVRHRLATKVKNPALPLIWRMVEGTGARPGEIAGLRLEDVHLEEGTTPHIKIEWHEDRRLKTATSIRSVPLIGDALDAAQEAVELAGGGNLLFAHYAGEGGSERLSAIMNKHVRAVSKDKRHVFYSLRHNMKDKLIASGADQRMENMLLEHSAGGVGDRTYGSEEARLKVAAGVMRKALGE